MIVKFTNKYPRQYKLVNPIHVVNPSYISVNPIRLLTIYTGTNTREYAREYKYKV